MIVPGNERIDRESVVVLSIMKVSMAHPTVQNPYSNILIAVSPVMLTESPIKLNTDSNNLQSK
jgi:hypothetical protein